MDFIDHLIYTTNTNNVRGLYPALFSENAGALSLPGIPGRAEDPVPVQPAALPPLGLGTDTFPVAVRENYIFYEDSSVIDKAIQKHWFDMTNGPINIFNLFGPTEAPPYHLMFAYLVENTRIVQIMERLIYLFQHDEKLGIASSNDPGHQQAFQWILNTEILFFKTLSNTSYRNISGTLRPNPEASRRNAYYRLLGMDLAFGDPNNEGATDYTYFKAKSTNKDFILLFEQFLSEIWQAYINAQNTSGANTTDYQRIIDMAVKLRQILMARRGGSGTITSRNYRFMNLSREEYSSVGFTSWLFNIVAYNSPVVNFLGCQANTSSERLINIGKKVGIEAHKKSQALFDMAPPTATILRLIEYGTYESFGSSSLWIREVIESQTPVGRGIATTNQANALLDLLTIINNWEKATGHRVKNVESNITGVVRVQSNGVKTQLVNN